MSNHPYLPKDLELPGYVPIALNQLQILAVYAIASIFVVLLVWFMAGKCSKNSFIDKLLMCWWAFSGLTHIILEGYFVFTPDFYSRSPASYLDEVWKEYSKGDSRYVARDSAVVTAEGITSVIEGPACLLIVYAIALNKPYSYVLQLSVCLGQLYGAAVYFITALLEGDNFYASPYYYWAYYIFANSFWLVIPTIVSVRCWRKITRALSSKKPKRR